MELIKTEMVDTGGGCKMCIGTFKTDDGMTRYINVSDDSYTVSTIYFMTEDKHEQELISNRSDVLLSGSLFGLNCMDSRYFQDILIIREFYEKSFDRQSQVSDKLRDLQWLIKTCDDNNKLGIEDWNDDVFTNCQWCITHILRDVIPDLQTLTE